MRYPFRYVLRNMGRRARHTLMTAAGIAVVVLAAVLMLSLAHGLRSRVDVTGDPENLVAISRKGQNAMFSNIEEDELAHLLSLEGVARSPFGEPLVSPEILHMSFMQAEGGTGGRDAVLYVRGVRDVALDVHPGVVVVEGSFPDGAREVMLGATAHVKLGLGREALRVGSRLRFENEDWTVSGFFDTGGAMIDSEVWVRDDDLMTALRRRTPTFAVVRFDSPAAAAAALRAFEQSGALFRFFKAWSEPAYYHEFTGTLRWVYGLVLVMVAAVTVAGGAIGVNTMYTAIRRRRSELAAQRVLGFSRTDIAAALFVESEIVALAGGVAGAALGALADGIPMRTTQGAFCIAVDLSTQMAGLGLAAVIGFVGAAVPQIKAARVRLVEALRDE
jgi:putative ABC transport system permease protein